MSTDRSRTVSEKAATFSSWEPHDWQCIAILVALVLFFYRDILLGSAFFFDDFIYFNYPSRNFAATTMAQGSMPLWNPYTFNGMPFLADIQTAVFYLPYLMLTLFVHNGSLHFYWLEFVTILHLIPAGVSMYFLTKSFGIRRMPSLCSAVIFVFSGFMICRMVHQHILSLVSWYPLILLLFRRSITGTKWYWVFLTAVVLGHSTLAGFPQLTLYLYFFLFLYFLFEFFTTYRLSEVFSRSAVVTAVKAGSVVVLSFAIAAIQLLPTFELAPLSQRAQISYDMAVQGSIAISQVLTFFIPKFFGSAGGEGYNYWGPGPYWHFWETCIYMGAIPLMLVLVSATLWKTNTRYIKFFWSIGIFALLYAFGDNFFIHRFFFDFVPGFSRFRDPARMSVFLSLSSSLLSGFALQHILFDPPSLKNIRMLRNLAIAVMVVASVLWMLTVSGSLSEAFSFFKNPQILSQVKKEANTSIIVFLVSGVMLLTLITRRLVKPWALLALMGLFYIDVFVFGGHQNTGTVNPKDYFTQRRQIVEFLKQESKSELFRVNTRNQEGMIMDRNQGMIDRIFMMEGFTPLVLQRLSAPLRTSDQLYDLLNVKYKTITDKVNRSLSLVLHPTYFPRAFFLYQIHVVSGEEELLSYLKSSEFNHRITAVLEKSPGFTLPALVDTPKWHANITSYESNRIMLDVETSNDGLLVLSEIYYPGWEVYVDGTPTEIYQTDYNLRGLFVPKGIHKIEMIFTPKSYADGAKVTIAALFLCGLGSTLSFIRTKKNRDS